MKFGIRKPNIKQRIKASTTGRFKRQIKKTLIPGYGKKGMGFIKNPKKSIYNKIYNKMSVDIMKPLAKSSIKKPPKNKLSWWKIILGICTCGISFIFTGFHK